MTYVFFNLSAKVESPFQLFLIRKDSFTGDPSVAYLNGMPLVRKAKYIRKIGDFLNESNIKCILNLEFLDKP